MHRWRNLFSILLFFSIGTGLQQTLASTSSLECRKAVNSESAGIRNESSPSLFQFTVDRLYVEGRARSNHFLFYSASEYSEILKNNVEAIPLDAILVLDRLPLVDDLPKVAGIILDEELMAENSHVQNLAERMEIPLAYAPGIFKNSELRSLIQNYRSFEIQCKDQTCKLEMSQTPVKGTIKRASILPKTADRGERLLFTRHVPLAFSPREQAGDKYYSLMEFRREFPEFVPDITALSSGYFEYFLKHYQQNGVRLDLLRFHLIQKSVNRDDSQSELESESQPESKDNEELLKQSLAEFRQAILTSQSSSTKSESIFQQMFEELKSYYGPTFGSLAIRSNNEVEDWLANGLYKSGVINTPNIQEFELAVRKVWASMYEYRAFAIRRYWGQREENLSMPLLIHPYVSDVYSHAVANLRFDPQTGLSLNVNMVMGKTEKATNPGDSAAVLKFSIVQNKKGKGELVFNSHDGGSEIPPFIRKPMLEFFKTVKKFMISEFKERVIAPEKMNLELVIEKPRHFWNSPRVQVLQYKPGYQREIILSLMSGLLTREEMDRRVIKTAKPSTTDRLIQDSSAYKLEDVVPEAMRAFYEGKKLQFRSAYRYALLMDEGKPFFIIWSSGIRHDEMKSKFTHSHLQWLKSGNIFFNSSGPIPILKFTVPTNFEETDRPLLLSLSKELFGQAFADAVSKNEELRKIILATKPIILFNTAEGSDSIDWPPKVGESNQNPE